MTDALAGLCLALGVQVRPAHAQSTLTVTDCSSDSQLQGDVSQANTDNDGDTITFRCSGDIKLSKTLTISGKMTIDGSGQSITLDGQQQFGVFLVQSGAILTLNALTISNGIGTPNSNRDGNQGGGIDNEGGTVSISNSTVSHNAVSPCCADGGGIANNGGTLIISTSTVSNNSASNGGGGIVDSGGGMTISTSTVSNNSAGIGGGIAIQGGTLTISTSTVSNNSSATIGGGIVNLSATTTIATSTVSNNSASGDGGGIDTENDGTTTINTSTVSSNSAGIGGGGIQNGEPEPFMNAGTTTINTSTVSNNSASSAGGIDNGFGTVSLRGNIIANNVGGNCAGASTDGGYNLSSDSSCSFTGTGSLQNTNPQLGPLANNGGPTQTMALQPGSPAIDAGPPAGQCPTTDQRGDPRPDNAEPTCDIGAYEFVDPVDNDLGLTVPSNQTVDATSPQGASVTYTVTATDPDDATSSPSISCRDAAGTSYPSGTNVSATFPIGPTTVTCTATDSDDSNSPVSQSFTVTVNGAATQVSNLTTTVNSFGLPPAFQASFDTQLQAVQTDLTNHNTHQACNDLKAFINHVKAQSGKGLTVSQANQLLAAATNIQKVLAC